MICFERDSNVLLKPCGHSGFCKDCITENLKRSQDCPVCRKEIKKIYLISFDEE